MASSLHLHRQDNQAVFVLHTYPFKETSLVVELFTQRFGRVAVLAKGARRPRSAMRGMLQSFQNLSGTWSGKNELKTLHSLDWSAGLTLLRGEALMCGFYMNELLLRLLPREDAHEALFDYYANTLNALSNIQAVNNSTELAMILRRFELTLLQELGYAIPLTQDENDAPIELDKTYRYEAEYGACALSATKNGVQLLGKTLMSMAQDDYSQPQTLQQSKQLMRYLLAHYLGDKPLHTRQLLIDLQGL
ncbi:MAG: DNA repair protein RecO [Methylophilales bacterium 28-44-11]|nr:MAG: DNA repair protein RecO [Methylophilales bacterium 28-44-11]